MCICFHLSKGTRRREENNNENLFAESENANQNFITVQMPTVSGMIILLNRVALWNINKRIDAEFDKESESTFRFLKVTLFMEIEGKMYMTMGMPKKCTFMSLTAEITSLLKIWK